MNVDLTHPLIGTQKDKLMFPRFSAAAFIFVVTTLLAGEALAHHSFADFDRSKTSTISGTVRALEWENPHIWLWVNTVDAKGNVAPWGFEGAAPAEMARRGFDRHKLNVGDKVTVTFSPLRDGRNGGSFSRIVKADSTVVAGRNGGTGRPPPGGTPGIKRQ